MIFCNYVLSSSQLHLDKGFCTTGASISQKYDGGYLYIIHDSSEIY